MQSAAGDTQFITDTYNNLLHRAPGRGDAAWYLAHAALLTDFSQSAKFLGDVQITSAHPADSQHWLLLI